jgi:hypothetical protein
VAGQGCGGGSGHASRPTPLGKTFQARATGVCRAALAEKRAQGPFPFPRFDPTRPDRSKLAPIARIEARTVAIYSRWLRKMRALGQPSTGRAAWSNVLTALATNGRIITDQQAAARRGDARRFTKDYFDGNQAQRHLESSATVAGLPACTTAAAA